MKVAVLAATGSTGSLVVDKLMANGHEVVAVSRSPARPRQSTIRYSAHTGDLTDAAFLHQAIAGCDAIISCLGQSRASKSLFARRTSPPDILSRVARATLAAIADRPQQLVYLSAFGVGDDLKRHALLFRIVLRLSTIHAAYLDHAEAEIAIRRSNTAWTIVRAPGLTDKDETIPLIDKSGSWSSFETASKRSIAAFLVQCVEGHGPLATLLTVGKAPA